MAEEFKPQELQVSFIPDVPPDSGPQIRFASGKGLRREYVYDQRSKYLLDKGGDYVWDEKKDGPNMGKWLEEAEKLYPDEGEYMVDTVTNVVTPLGIK